MKISPKEVYLCCKNKNMHEIYRPPKLYSIQYLFSGLSNFVLVPMFARHDGCGLWYFSPILHHWNQTYHLTFYLDFSGCFGSLILLILSIVRILHSSIARPFAHQITTANLYFWLAFSTSMLLFRQITYPPQKEHHEDYYYNSRTRRCLSRENFKEQRSS